jgi:hypothetical protein
MHPGKRLLLAGVCALVFGLTASPVRADIILQDNFNSENGGVGALNYAGFANWNVTGGTVDLIGNGFFDFYPGNGLYVDLDGSTLMPGLLSSKITFPPGTYLLQFDLGGSQRGTSENVTVSLGSYSEVFHRNSGDPLALVTRTITTTIPGSLSFQNDNDFDNIGAILDNVTVATVPEPTSLALLGVGLAGLVGFRLRPRTA